MNTFSNQNPERIKYWIKNNIHMVWDAVKKLQQPELKGFILRITFPKDSFPIVMQWKTESKELKRADSILKEDTWDIVPEFSSINAFSDWVINIDLLN